MALQRSKDWLLPLGPGSTIRSNPCGPVHDFRSRSSGLVQKLKRVRRRHGAENFTTYPPFLTSLISSFSPSWFSPLRRLDKLRSNTYLHENCIQPGFRYGEKSENMLRSLGPWIAVRQPFRSRVVSRYPVPCVKRSGTSGSTPSYLTPEAKWTRFTKY